MRAFSATIFAVVLAIAGCESSDPATSDIHEISDLLPYDNQIDQDVQSIDIAGDEGALEDTNTTADSTETDVTGTDTQTDLISDVGNLDVPPDRDPPYVVSSSPADDATGIAIPFTVSVTFNEPIRFSATVNEDNFFVADFFGNVLLGELAYDEETYTVTFTPSAESVFHRAIPYTLTMREYITDKAGNRIDKTYIRWSTEAWPNQSGYETLAAKYSPIIYQAVNTNAPHLDYITSWDFDADKDVTNNDKNYLKVTEVPTWVYYDVVETKSHYFIRYVYFHVRHTESVESKNFGNEAAGALVVVAKYPSMTPIAVETYFSGASYQDIRSFVTEESGLVIDGATVSANGNLNDNDRKYYNVNWVFNAANLFPNGHYLAYITEGTHESCSWIQTNEESGMDFRCELTQALKDSMKVINYSFTDGTSQSILKSATGFPNQTAQGQSYSYGLRSVMDNWWVVRDRDDEGEIFGNLTTYTANEGAFSIGNLKYPRAFQNTSDDGNSGGRPPWSWNWIPSVPDAYYSTAEFNEGTFFFDPAYYFAIRHRLTMSVGSAGFSSSYCYNPYLLIDQRDKDSDCMSN